MSAREDIGLATPAVTGRCSYPYLLVEAGLGGIVIVCAKHFLCFLYLSLFVSKRAGTSEALVSSIRSGLGLGHFLGLCPSRDEAALGTKTVLSFLTVLGLDEAL